MAWLIVACATCGIGGWAQSRLQSIQCDTKATLQVMGRTPDCEFLLGCPYGYHYCSSFWNLCGGQRIQTVTLNASYLTLGGGVSGGGNDSWSGGASLDANFAFLFTSPYPYLHIQDCSAVPALLDILQKAVRDGVDKGLLLVRPQRGMPWSASYPAHLHTATIVALGRLGDLRAIPVLEAFRNHHEYRRFAPLVSVAVARIKAEQAVPQADTLAKWQAKVERFAEALGLSLSDLISTVRQTRDVHSGRSAPAQPQLALRALAEMAAEAYRQGCKESFDWLQRAGVEWDADRVAWDVLRYALMFCASDW